MNFCVLGADAWGTALAIQLIRQGHSVTLVVDRIDAAMELASTRENSAFLPGCSLPMQLQIGFEVKPVLMEADVVVFSVSDERLKNRCQTVARYLDSSVALKWAITLGAGIEEASSSQAADLVKEYLPGVSHAELTATGSAKELADGKPGVVRLDGADEEPLFSQIKEAIVL